MTQEGNLGLRKCHDCPRLTTDYRCPECRRKWQKKHGVEINGKGNDWDTQRGMPEHRGGSWREDF